MELDRAVATAGEEIGPSSDDELARGAERDPLHGAHGLPVADVVADVASGILAADIQDRDGAPALLTSIRSTLP